MVVGNNLDQGPFFLFFFGLRQSYSLMVFNGPNLSARLKEGMVVLYKCSMYIYVHVCNRQYHSSSPTNNLYVVSVWCSSSCVKLLSLDMIDAPSEQMTSRKLMKCDSKTCRIVKLIRVVKIISCFLKRFLKCKFSTMTLQFVIIKLLLSEALSVCYLKIITNKSKLT